VYLAIVVLMGVLFIRIPKSVPAGRGQGCAVLPGHCAAGYSGGSHQKKWLDLVRAHFLAEIAVSGPASRSVASVSVATGKASGLAFVSLKGWGAERGKGDNSAKRNRRARQ